jgi:hypothetical protein
MEQKKESNCHAGIPRSYVYWQLDPVALRCQRGIRLGGLSALLACYEVLQKIDGSLRTVRISGCVDRERVLPTHKPKGCLDVSLTPSVNKVFIDHFLHVGRFGSHAHNFQ